MRSKGGEHDTELTGGKGNTWPSWRKEESSEVPVGAGGYVLFGGTRAYAVCTCSLNVDRRSLDGDRIAMSRTARNRSATVTDLPLPIPLLLKQRVFGSDMALVKAGRGGPGVIAIRRETTTAVGGRRAGKGERATGKGGPKKEQLGGPDNRKPDSDQGKGRHREGEHEKQDRCGR